MRISAIRTAPIFRYQPQQTLNVARGPGLAGAEARHAKVNEPRIAARGDVTTRFPGGEVREFRVDLLA